jgi:hypothetical protein
MDTVMSIRVKGEEYYDELSNYQLVNENPTHDGVHDYNNTDLCRHA